LHTDDPGEEDEMDRRVAVVIALAAIGVLLAAALATCRARPSVPAPARKPPGFNPGGPRTPAP
jgi:hypothetical protein